MFEVGRILVGFVILAGSVCELTIRRPDRRKPSYILVGAGIILGLVWFMATGGLSGTPRDVIEALATLALAVIFAFVFERVLARRVAR